MKRYIIKKDKKYFELHSEEYIKQITFGLPLFTTNLQEAFIFNNKALANQALQFGFMKVPINIEITI